MKRSVHNTIGYLSGISSIMTGINFYESRKIAKFKAEMEAQIAEMKRELVTEQIKNSDLKTLLETKILALKDTTNKTVEIFEDCTTAQETNSMSFTVLKQKAQEHFQGMSKIVEDMSDSISKDTKNFIGDDITGYISAFQDYLATLTLEQTFCLVHMLAVTSLFIFLINLAVVFYGESLIKYFELEIKFPKLAKFISLRRKFQQYYFAWNLILIVTILAGLFYFNLKVFLL